MAKATNKNEMQTSIYQIEAGTSLDDVANSALGLDYLEQKLKQKSIDGNCLRLFYKRYPMTPKWKEFLGDVVEPNEEALETKKSRQENYVLLVEISASKNLYAITGGYGHSAVGKYINQDFGLDVLARLVTKDEKSLKSTKEKSFVGGILGTSKFFRSNFNFYENEEFGRIYQELQAAVGKELLVSEFGFSDSDLKKGIICTAKSSFRINTSISLKKAVEIITACESVLQKTPSLVINSVRKLTKRKDQSLLDKLEDELLTQLWERFNNQPDSFPFDLCHADFERYLTAQTFEVQIRRSRKDKDSDSTSRVIVNYLGEVIFDSLSDMDQLFDEMRQKITIKDKKHFSNQLRKLNIVSFDDDGKEVTKADLFSHLMGDVAIGNDRYFFVDKSWYLIEDTFLSDLNSSCSSFVKNNMASLSLEAWDCGSMSENDYNALYIGKQNCIVLDRIVPENIELCDILIWDDDKLYLVHVKKGFGNTMRDLCAQLSISANRVMQDRKTQPSLQFLSAIYDDLSAKKGATGYFGHAGNQTNSITKDQFLALFEKEIYFVLGVLDTATNQRNLVEIEKFKSSIAKFSMHVLVQSMASIGQRLQIAQIPPG